MFLGLRKGCISPNSFQLLRVLALLAKINVATDLGKRLAQCSPRFSRIEKVSPKCLSILLMFLFFLYMSCICPFILLHFSSFSSFSRFLIIFDFCSSVFVVERPFGGAQPGARRGLRQGLPRPRAQCTKTLARSRAKRRGDEE